MSDTLMAIGVDAWILSLLVWGRNNEFVLTALSAGMGAILYSLRWIDEAGMVDPYVLVNYVSIPFIFFILVSTLLIFRIVSIKMRQAGRLRSTVGSRKYK